MLLIRVAMNSFSDWLKVVLAVVVLALLAEGISFHRVQERRVRQNVENHRGTQGDAVFQRRWEA
jgi:hypothetical protein